MASYCCKSNCLVTSTRAYVMYISGYVLAINSRCCGRTSLFTISDSMSIILPRLVALLVWTIWELRPTRLSMDSMHILTSMPSICRLFLPQVLLIPLQLVLIAPNDIHQMHLLIMNSVAAPFSTVTTVCAANVIPILDANNPVAYNISLALFSF